MIAELDAAAFRAEVIAAPWARQRTHSKPTRRPPRNSFRF